MDTAYLFDHAKGHTLPRHKDTVKELGDVLRIMISNIETDSHSSSDGSFSIWDGLLPALVVVGSNEHEIAG